MILGIAERDHFIIDAVTKSKASESLYRSGNNDNGENGF